jgi:riboflavin synthase
MFTGIIEETGTIKNIQKGEKSSNLTIEAAKVLDKTNVGDSIAVNGICLTVTKTGAGYFMADVMAESLRRTNLGDLRPGAHVNLERALCLNSRLGGHIVSGHIDGTGTISNLQREDNAVWVTVYTGENILKYIVEKGSIAIDGISLTVAYVDNEKFKVSIIPHTGDETILLKKKIKDTVNIECDIIGKYIEKFARCENQSGITEDFLKENGF